MNSELNILFLGGAKRVSLAECFINTGRRKGLDIHIFSYELTQYVPICTVGTIINGFKWDDLRIFDHLLEIIIKYKINIIFPLVDPAITIASRLKYLSPKIFIPCSDFDICNIMFDKKKAALWFSESDFPVPKDYSCEKEIDKYPVILKPQTGSASKGIKVIYNPIEFKEFEIQHDIEHYFIQQYFSPSTEYTVDCYVNKENEIISVVPRIRLEVAGGEVTKTITEKNLFLIELSKKILNKGQFQGPITIQFIKDIISGEMFVLEINPRFGGGVIASILAGADIISSIIEEHSGIHTKIISTEKWNDKTLMTRYFKEVIFQCS